MEWIENRIGKCLLCIIVYWFSISTNCLRYVKRTDSMNCVITTARGCFVFMLLFTVAIIVLISFMAVIPNKNPPMASDNMWAMYPIVLPVISIWKATPITYPIGFLQSNGNLFVLDDYNYIQFKWKFRKMHHFKIYHIGSGNWRASGPKSAVKYENKLKIATGKT